MRRQLLRLCNETKLIYALKISVKISVIILSIVGNSIKCAGWMGLSKRQKQHISSYDCNRIAATNLQTAASIW